MSFITLVSLTFFICAGLSVLSGRTYLKGHVGPVLREEEPRTFWMAVGIYTFMGCFMLYVSHHMIAR